MNFPQFPKKYGQDVVITPKQHFFAENVNYKDFQPPKSVILCFESWIVDHFKKLGNTVHRSFWSGEMIYLNEHKKEIALVGNFGIGGPAATHIQEILIAVGVKNFIVVGHAGGLQKTNPVGTILLVDKALRDEGVSHHYLEPDRYAYPSPSLLNKLKNALNRNNLNCKMGSSWTIDSMYRETKEEIKHYALEGIASVEMELASLFAVATFRNVQIAALLVVSDLVACEKWDEQINSVSTSTAIFKSVEIAKKVLNNG